MNNNIETSIEIRRIYMLITPCKRSATRGMKQSIFPNSVGVQCIYGFAKAVETRHATSLRSSRDGAHSVSPCCASLTRGYQHINPSDLFRIVDYFSFLNVFRNPKDFNLDNPV